MRDDSIVILSEEHQEAVALLGHAQALIALMALGSRDNLEKDLALLREDIVGLARILQVELDDFTRMLKWQTPT